MKFQRKCKICRGDFVAIKATQFFCSRKCFKRDYYLRTKTQIQHQSRAPKYPSKNCLYCGSTSQLDFNPLKTPTLYNQWACPFCGATNQLIWEHQNNPDSHQVIQSILVSVEYSRSTTMMISHSQYQTYSIPIESSEHALEKSPIVMMPCGAIDFYDIHNNQNRQRRRRRATTL